MDRKVAITLVVFAVLGIAVVVAYLKIRDAPPAPLDVTQSLPMGGVLNQGHRIYDADGKYYLAMQTDGNLVVYDENNVAKWSCCFANWGNAPYKLVNQTDGNLVLYDSTGAVQWSTETSIARNTAAPNMSLTIDKYSGALVLTDPSGHVWWPSDL